MPKRNLRVDRLLGSGFEVVGCWELNDARDLSHRIKLPQRAGVYAFAIDGIVQYVGLAAKSLKQRLGFYRKPGASQRTNVRLNEIIRGHLGEGRTVQVLIAHPPDYEWNGLKISGAEGLEAGLISEFDLPWNVRGSAPVIAETNGSGALTDARQTGRAARIMALVQEKPGLTGGEIATAIYGLKGAQPQVNALLQELMEQGAIERRGPGGSHPYRYYPTHAQRQT